MNPLPATLNEAYLAIQEADAHARAAEVALMVGIAKAAELYEVNDAAVMDAVEGFLEPGGDGTPSVGEFLAHELGGILQISPDAALGEDRNGPGRAVPFPCSVGGLPVRVASLVAGCRGGEPASGVPAEG